MFGNLVLIEITRLYNSFILRISGMIAVFILLLMMLVGEVVVQAGGVQMIPIDTTTGFFRIALFEVQFQGLTMMVAGLTVAHTTCSYYKNRLAVNIEGAVRSRLKLCLSEICGIAVFVIALNLLVFPGIAVILAGNTSEIANLITNISNLKDAYIFSCMASMFACLIVYMISKIIHNTPVAVILAMLIELLSLVLVIFMTGFIKGYEDAGGALAPGAEDVLCTSVFVLPLVVLGIVALVKEKKVDRI